MGIWQVCRPDHTKFGTDTENRVIGEKERKDRIIEMQIDQENSYEKRVCGSKAKIYQVGQVRKIILKYKLGGKE